MTLLSFFQITLSSIVAGGAASLLIIFLSKSLLSQLLAKELEQHKIELMGELELFKTNLNKNLHSFGTQFSRIDQQRATAIMQIHGIMCQIDNSVYWESGTSANPLLSASPELDTITALNKAWENLGKLSDVTAYHSLLLDDQIHVEVIEWAKIMMGMIADVCTEVDSLRKTFDGSIDSLETRRITIESIRDKYLDQNESKLASSRKDIEGYFRRILGLDYLQQTKA